MFINSKLKKAANIPNPNSKEFTEDDFFEFMPQFQKIVKKTTNEGQEYEIRTSLIPQKALDNFLKMANMNVLQSRWFEKWEWACSLYVAHYSTLFLETYSESSNSINDITGNKGASGLVSSTSLGDVSISYDNSMITNNMSKWGMWASTPYGKQLVQEAKLLGVGGAYFI